MKKIILALFCVCLFLSAMGTTPAQSAMQPGVSGTTGSSAQDLLIDNFDDADITNAPNWWTFDRIQTSFPEAAEKRYGLYYLKVTGKAENYYVGGMGTYLGKDASMLDTWSMDVYGNGPASGTIKIQMFDDDNGNYQIEQDSKYEPLYDDRVEYELPVTWTGWQTVEIPFNKFVDTNPGIGDDIFNPDQKNGSGGLLQIQLIFLATSPTGNVNIGIDNIRLIKKQQ